MFRGKNAGDNRVCMLMACTSDSVKNAGQPVCNFKRFLVNKTELIEHIAKHADLSKAAAGRALEATIGAVRTTLKKAAPCRWWVLVLSLWASALPAQVVTHVPALRLKSNLPRFQSSVQAKASRML